MGRLFVACIQFGNKKVNESPDTIIWYDDILLIGNSIIQDQHV